MQEVTKLWPYPDLEAFAGKSDVHIDAHTVGELGMKEAALERYESWSLRLRELSRQRRVDFVAGMGPILESAARLSEDRVFLDGMQSIRDCANMWK